MSGSPWRPSAVDRADGVDDVPGAQLAAAGDLGVPGGAAAEAAALREDRWAAGAVDGAVDTPAAEQRRVGGVDDRIRVLPCDVAAHQLDTACEVTGHA